MYQKLDGIEWYERKTSVKSPLGLHGRPAVDLSGVAGQYAGRVLLIYKESSIDMKTPMELLLHCIFHSSSVIVRVEKGEGCERIASQLVEILERTD